MTDTVTPTVEQKKSRRGLLALVGAGGAAAAAALFGKSDGAEADPGDYFTLGQSNYGGTEETYLGASRSAGAALYARNLSSDSGAIGIAGQSDGGTGVHGLSGGDGGAGVHGETTGANATGVKGYSGLGTGVKGESAASGSPWDLAGVHGTSGAGTGVLGQSSDFIGVHGTSDNSDAVRGDAAGSGAGVAGVSSDGPGVHGSGNMGVHGTGSALGVSGQSDTGVGVQGLSDQALGVMGQSFHGTGVKGYGKPGVYGVSFNGSGVRGEGTGDSSIGLYGVNTPDRRALRTKGRVQMDTARKVTLSNRANLVTLPTGVQAGAFAIVLAMVQGASGNGAFVRRAWRVDDKHIRITFDKKPANPTAVGYWVVQTG